jgi:hypothetical protein
MSPLVLLLMASCPVAAGPAQAVEARSIFSREGSEPAPPEQNTGGRHGFFSRFRGWFHRSSHGNDNQAPGDWGGKATGYPSVPGDGPPPSYSPAGTMPAPLRVPTTAEPPLAVPGPPGR